MTPAGWNPKLLPGRPYGASCGRAHRLAPACGLLPVSVRAQAAGPDSIRAVVLAPDAVWDGTADARGAAGWWWCGDSGSKRWARRRARRRRPAPNGSRCRGRPSFRGSSRGTRICSCTPTTRRSWDDQVLKEPLGAAHRRARWRTRAATLRGRDSPPSATSAPRGPATHDVGFGAPSSRASSPGRGCSWSPAAIVATGSYGPAGAATPCRSAAGRGGGRRRGRDRAGGARARSAAGPTGSRCTPTTAGAPAGSSRPTFTPARARGDRRDGARGRPAGGGARDDDGGDAAGGAGRRRDHRARRRGHAGGVPADAQARRGLLPDAGGGRGVCHVLRRVGQGPRRADAGAGQPSGPASGRRSTRA